MFETKTANVYHSFKLELCTKEYIQKFLYIRYSIEVLEYFDYGVNEYVEQKISGVWCIVWAVDIK